MECPWRGNTVATAIKKCPFLHQLAQDCGEDYAASVAVHSGCPPCPPTFPEALTDCKASFELFHGTYGVLPLAGRGAQQVQQGGREGGLPDADLPVAAAQEMRAAAVHAKPTLSAAPFASLGTRVFRFLPGPGDFIARRRLKRQKRQRKPRANSDQFRQPDRATKAQRWQRPDLGRWRTHPLLGGLIPLNAAGRYACPPLVVAARTAVARWRSVQFLRPQALPVKLLGVGGHCFAANVPCGAVREHTEKFSAAWFLAVHATVPFFAFMRKGVGMPKWAILLTLAAAIAGQTLGSRLERARLEYDAAQQSGTGGSPGSRRPRRDTSWNELLASRCGLPAFSAHLPGNSHLNVLPSMPVSVM